MHGSDTRADNGREAMRVMQVCTQFFETSKFAGAPNRRHAD
jgi:hypothetical protein